METISLMLIAGLLVLFGLGAFVFWFNRAYNIKVVIREVTNNRKIIKRDIARLYVNGEGVEVLQLFKEGVSVATPPSDAFEIDRFGKRFIEMYKLGDREYQFIVDQTKINPEKVKIGADVIVRKSNEGDFEHLKTNQRIALVNQIIKAQSRKKKTWQDVLIQTAPILAVVIISVSLMIFWGDMAQPLLEQGDKMVQISEQQVQTQKLLNQILTREQLIEGADIGGGSP